MPQSHGDAVYGITAAIITQGANYATTADLNNEAALRKAADTAEVTARDAAIGVESTNRTNALVKLAADVNTDLSSEANTRLNNDKTLNSAIITEINARTAAIASEVSARDAAILVETNARVAADNTLSAAIDSEATTRSNAIAAETNARINGDSKTSVLSTLGATQLTGSNSGDETHDSIINKIGYVPARDMTAGGIGSVCVVYRAGNLGYTLGGIYDITPYTGTDTQSATSSPALPGSWLCLAANQVQWSPYYGGGTDNNIDPGTDYIIYTMKRVA